LKFSLKGRAALLAIVITLPHFISRSELLFRLAQARLNFMALLRQFSNPTTVFDALLMFAVVQVHNFISQELKHGADGG